jgi:hypothetical protein
MINLEDLFNDFFDCKEFSLTELCMTASDWVGRMTQVNPAGVFSARITALAGALASVEANTTDAGVKLGVQKGATQNKKNFRKALQENMAKVHAKVVAQFGKNSPELLQIFPKGLAPFQKDAEQEKVENELGVVLAGVTAHAAALPAGLVSDVGGYLSGWLVVYNASKGSQAAKKMSNFSGGDLRKALQIEMTKTALFVAFTYPGDQAKGHFYLPTTHLFNPQQQKPHAPDLTVNFGIGRYEVTAEVGNADEVVFLARDGGAGAFAEVGRTPPGETLIVDHAPGVVEVKAFAVNGAGNSPEVVSGEVT